MAFVTQPSPVDNVRDLLFKLLQGFADGTYGTTATLKYLPHPSDTEWDITRKMLSGFSDGSFTGTAHTAYAPAQGDNLYNLTRKLLQGFADGAFSSGTSAALLKSFSPGDSQWQLYRKLVQGFADGSFTGGSAVPEKMPSPADKDWDLLAKLSLGFYAGTFSISNTPACTNVPLAPDNLAVVTTTTSTITFDWSQPLSIPDAPVGSYIVSWGSAPGNYNIGSATIPDAPQSYTITGLSSFETVYVVVQAIGVDGCPGGTSVESVFTSSMGLTTSIAAYWKLDEASNTTRVDSTGSGQDLTDVNSNTPAGTGLINNGIAISNTANQILTHADNAVLGIGAGVSFTISCWYNQATFFGPIVTKWDTGNAALQDYFIWVDTNGNFGNGFFTFAAIDLSGTSHKIFSNVQASGSFHHIAAGFDNDTGTMWIQVDNGVRISKAISGVRRTAAGFAVGNFVTGAGNGGTVDEVGFWRRTLTTTEISELYNGGAGIQYPFAGAAAGTIGATLSAYTSLWWQNTYANSGDASNNGGAVSSTNLASLDGLLTSITSAGLLSKVIALNCLTPDNIVAATWPFIGIAGAQPAAKWTNHNFAGAELTINGLLGANNKYLDSGLQDSTVFPAVSNCGISVYVHTDVSEAAYAGALLVTDLTTGLLVRSNLAGSAAFHSYDGGITGATIGAGFYSGNRTGANATALYAANSGTAFAAIATGVNATTKPFQACNLYFFGNNTGNNTPFAGLYTTRRISVVVVHQALTSSEAQSLFNSVQAYLVARGGGYV